MSETPKIFYYYLRDSQNRPIGTVAFCYEKSTIRDGIKMVTRGIALCCPADNVNKARGREVARNKCLKYHYQKVVRPKVVTREWWTIFKGVIRAYIDTQGYFKPANEIEQKILK